MYLDALNAENVVFQQDAVPSYYHEDVKYSIPGEWCGHGGMFPCLCLGCFSTYLSKEM
jgi:hypothetical protein